MTSNGEPTSALVIDTALILYHEDGNPIAEFDRLKVPGRWWTIGVAKTTFEELPR